MAASEETCDGNPNFAVICSFITKFGDDCGVNISIPYLQQMLEDTKDVHPDLQELIIHLLRRGRKRVNKERWEKCLIKFCHEYNSVDAWELERFGFLKSKLSVKLELLKRLLELQFDANAKFKAEVNKLDAGSLRILPLGRDIDGQSYWYQLDKEYNMRLYRETVGEDGEWKLVCSTTEDLRTLLASLEKKYSVSTGECKPEDSDNPKSPSSDMPVPKKERDTDDLTSHLSESKPCTIIIKTEKRDSHSHSETTTNCVKNETFSIVKNANEDMDITDADGNKKVATMRLKLKVEPSSNSKMDQKPDIDAHEATSVVKQSTAAVPDPEPMSIDTPETKEVEAVPSSQNTSSGDVEMKELEVDKSKSEEHTDQKMSTDDSNMPVDTEKSDSVNHHKSSKIKLYEKWSNEKKKLDASRNITEECDIDSKMPSLVEEKEQSNSNQKSDPAIPLKCPPEEMEVCSDQNVVADIEMAVDLSKSPRVNVIVQNTSSKPALSNGVPPLNLSHEEKLGNDVCASNASSNSTETIKKLESSVKSAERSSEKTDFKHQSRESESKKFHKKSKMFSDYYSPSVISSTNNSGSGLSHLQALQNMCESNAMGGIPSVIQSTTRHSVESNRGVISESRTANNSVSFENMSKKYNFNEVHSSSDKIHADDQKSTDVLLKSNVHRKEEKKEQKEKDELPVKSTSDDSELLPTDLSCSTGKKSSKNESNSTSKESLNKTDIPTVIEKNSSAISMNDKQAVKSDEENSDSKKDQSKVSNISSEKECNRVNDNVASSCNSSQNKTFSENCDKAEKVLSLDTKSCEKEQSMENYSETVAASGKIGHYKKDLSRKLLDTKNFPNDMSSNNSLTKREDADKVTDDNVTKSCPSSDDSKNSTLKDAKSETSDVLSKEIETKVSDDKKEPSKSTDCGLQESKRESKKKITNTDSSLHLDSDVVQSVKDLVKTASSVRSVSNNDEDKASVDTATVDVVDRKNVDASAAYKNKCESESTNHISSKSCIPKESSTDVETNASEKFSKLGEKVKKDTKEKPGDNNQGLELISKSDKKLKTKNDTGEAAEECHTIKCDMRQDNADISKLVEQSNKPLDSDKESALKKKESEGKSKKTEESKKICSDEENISKKSDCKEKSKNVEDSKKILDSDKEGKDCKEMAGSIESNKKQLDGDKEGQSIKEKPKSPTDSKKRLHSDKEGGSYKETSKTIENSQKQLDCDKEGKDCKEKSQNNENSKKSSDVDKKDKDSEDKSKTAEESKKSFDKESVEKKDYKGKSKSIEENNKSFDKESVLENKDNKEKSRSIEACKKPSDTDNEGKSCKEKSKDIEDSKKLSDKDEKGSKIKSKSIEDSMEPLDCDKEDTDCKEKSKTAEESKKSLDKENVELKDSKEKSQSIEKSKTPLSKEGIEEKDYKENSKTEERKKSLDEESVSENKDNKEKSETEKRKKSLDKESISEKKDNKEKSKMTEERKKSLDKKSESGKEDYKEKPKITEESKKSLDKENELEIKESKEKSKTTEESKKLLHKESTREKKECKEKSKSTDESKKLLDKGSALDKKDSKETSKTPEKRKKLLDDIESEKEDCKEKSKATKENKKSLDKESTLEKKDSKEKSKTTEESKKLLDKESASEKKEGKEKSKTTEESKKLLDKESTPEKKDSKEKSKSTGDSKKLFDKGSTSEKKDSKEKSKTTEESKKSLDKESALEKKDSKEKSKTTEESKKSPDKGSMLEKKDHKEKSKKSEESKETSSVKESVLVGKDSKQKLKKTEESEKTLADDKESVMEERDGKGISKSLENEKPVEKEKDDVSEKKDSEELPKKTVDDEALMKDIKLEKKDKEITKKAKTDNAIDDDKNKISEEKEGKEVSEKEEEGKEEIPSNCQDKVLEKKGSKRKSKRNEKEKQSKISDSVSDEKNHNDKSKKASKSLKESKSLEVEKHSSKENKDMCASKMEATSTPESVSTEKNEKEIDKNTSENKSLENCESEIAKEDLEKEKEKMEIAPTDDKDAELEKSASTKDRTEPSDDSKPEDSSKKVDDQGDDSSNRDDKCDTKAINDSKSKTTRSRASRKTPARKNRRNAKSSNVDLIDLEEVNEDVLSTKEKESKRTPARKNCKNAKNSNVDIIDLEVNEDILRTKEKESKKESAMCDKEESSITVSKKEVKESNETEINAKDVFLIEKFKVYNLRRSICLETKFKHPACDKYVRKPKTIPPERVIELLDEEDSCSNEVSPPKTKTRLRGKNAKQTVAEKKPQPPAKKAPTPAKKAASNSKKTPASRNRKKEAVEKDDFGIPEGFLEILGNADKSTPEKGTARKKRKGFELKEANDSLPSSENESTPIKRSRRIREQTQKKLSELAVEMEREQRMLEQMAKRSNSAAKKNNKTATPQKSPAKANVKASPAKTNAKGTSTPTKSPKVKGKISEPVTEEDTCMDSTTSRRTRRTNSRAKNLTKMTLMYEDESKDSQFSTSRETEKSKKRKRGRGQKKGFKPWDVSSESSSSIEELTEEEEEEPDEPLIFEVNEDEFACEEVDPNAEPVIVRRARTAKKIIAEIEDAAEECINDDTPCKKCGKYDKPEWILLCDKCDSGYHTHCLIPPLMLVPDGDWFCQPCEHMSLCQCLHEEINKLEVILKQKEREELRKQRLAYVGISLDNVLKPEKKEKSEEESSKEEEEIKKEQENRKPRHQARQPPEEDDRNEKLYGKRSVRARRNVNYQFKEYDALILSAVQEDMVEIPEEFKEEGSEAGSDKPFKAKITKKKKRGRKWKDFDSTDDEDSGEEYQGASTDSEATAPPSSHTEQESGSGDEWRVVKTKKKPQRKSRSRRRRRGDSSEEDWEDEVVEKDAYRPTTRRAAQKAVSYREISSEDDEWGIPKVRPQAQKRRKASSSDSEASFKKKNSKKKRIRKWGSDSSEESEEEKSMSSSGESEEEEGEESQEESENEFKVNRKDGTKSKESSKKVVSSDEEESSTQDSAPKKKAKKYISDESEEEEEEEEEEESESEENSEEDEEEDEEEEEKGEKKTAVPVKKAPPPPTADKVTSKPNVETKEPSGEKLSGTVAEKKITPVDKEASPTIPENKSLQPKVLVKKELCSVDIPLEVEPIKQPVVFPSISEKAPAPPKTVRKETTKMVPCVIPYEKSPKSGHASNPEEECDKEIPREVERARPPMPLNRPLPFPKQPGVPFTPPSNRIQFGGVLARHSVPPLTPSVRPPMPPSNLPQRFIAPTNLSTRPSAPSSVLVRHHAPHGRLPPARPASGMPVPPSVPPMAAPPLQTAQNKSENKPYKSTIMEPFSNMDDENDSDDEVPLERIPTACAPAPLPNRPVSYDKEAEYRPAAKELPSYSYAPPEEKSFPASYSSLSSFQDYSTRPSPLKPSLVETYPNNSSPSKLTPLDSYSTNLTPLDKTSSPKGFISLDSYSENRKKKHFYGSTSQEAEPPHRPPAPAPAPAPPSENYQGGEIRFPPEPYPCPQSPNTYSHNRSPPPTPSAAPPATQRDPGTPPRMYSQFPDAYAPPRSPEYYQNHQYYASEERIARPSYQPNYAPQEPSFVSNPYVATPVPQPNGGFMIDTLLRARNQEEGHEDELTGVTDIVSYITQE